MSRLSLRTTVALAALGLLASACSGGGESEAGAAEGVASIDDTTTDASSTEDETGAADAELSADEAALAFSACMRDEGLDFPDIGVDADGNLNLRQAFVDADLAPRSPEFQAGMEVCGELIAAAGFGAGGGRAALGDNPEIQDALVEFSECLRDAGHDVGDLTLGGGPGAGDGQPPADATGEGDGESQGQRGQGQGGFGDRNSRFAAQLGLDIEDPVVAADIETCAPIIDTAFADAGVGGRP